jgi:hypothetical protein
MEQHARDGGGGEVVVRNGGARQLQLVLHPVGTVHQLDPDAAFEVRARGPIPGRLTVEHADNAIIVKGPRGAVLVARRINGLVDDETRRLCPAAALDLVVQHELFADEEEPEGGEAL